MNGYVLHVHKPEAGAGILKLPTRIYLGPGAGCTEIASASV